jgi:hypothetical protein
VKRAAVIILAIILAGCSAGRDFQDDDDYVQRVNVEGVECIIVSYSGVAIDCNW